MNNSQHSHMTHSLSLSPTTTMPLHDTGEEGAVMCYERQALPQGWLCMPMYLCLVTRGVVYLNLT